MLQKMRELFPYATHTGIIALVLVLGILSFGGYAVSLPKPGGARPAVPNREATQVYEHTYDEVFQASLDAIERMGLFVTAKDKDKGTISGGGRYRAGAQDPYGQITFDLRIEAISTKPETRLTAHAQAKGILSKGYDWAFV